MELYQAGITEEEHDAEKLQFPSEPEVGVAYSPLACTISSAHRITYPVPGVFLAQAASVHCRDRERNLEAMPDGTKNAKMLSSQEHRTRNIPQRCFDAPGTQYLILDCGGGTVDMTLHQVPTNTLPRPASSSCTPPTTTTTTLTTF